MTQPCGCGGGSAPAAASGSAPATFAIQLPNGTKVGSYPTRDHARVALASSYNNHGTVVAK